MNTRRSVSTRAALAAAVLALGAVLGSACQRREVSDAATPADERQQAGGAQEPQPVVKQEQPAPVKAAPPAASPSGSPPAEPPLAGTRPVKEKKSPFEGIKPKDVEPEPQPEPPPNLGPPLVEHPEELIHLDPVFPTWINPQRKQVVMVGEVCRAQMGLEMFITLRAAEKDYESVIVVDTKAAIVHAALLRLGAEPGSPVQFVPKYVPAKGTAVEIQLIWKDAQGARHQARAQDWLRNVRGGKPLEYNWVFAGSAFWTDKAAKTTFYLAEGGYLVCVANTPSALLDLPIPSSGGLEAREFEANAARMPPKGTAVTILLIPKLPPKAQKK